MPVHLPLHHTLLPLLQTMLQLERLAAAAAACQVFIGSPTMHRMYLHHHH
jgi:hypothetical protein